MSHKFKGDISITRAIYAARRSDEGLIDKGALTGNVTLTEFDHAWQTMDPNGSDRDVTLPDATTLEIGWQLRLHNNGSANNLLLKANGGTLLETVEFDSVAEATLIDNGIAAGVWHVIDLNTESQTNKTIQTQFFGQGNVGNKFLSLGASSKTSDEVPYIVMHDSDLVGFTWSNTSGSANVDIEVFKNGLVDPTNIIGTYPVNAHLTMAKSNITPVQLNHGDRVSLFLNKDTTNAVNPIVALYFQVRAETSSEVVT